jgi:hypothetical protein
VAHVGAAPQRCLGRSYCKFHTTRGRWRAAALPRRYRLVPCGSPVAGTSRAPRVEGGRPSQSERGGVNLRAHGWITAVRTVMSASAASPVDPYAWRGRDLCHRRWCGLLINPALGGRRTRHCSGSLALPCASDPWVAVASCVPLHCQRSPLSLTASAPRTDGTILALVGEGVLARPLASVSSRSAPRCAWRFVHRQRMGCPPHRTLQRWQPCARTGGHLGSS